MKKNFALGYRLMALFMAVVITILSFTACKNNDPSINSEVNESMSDNQSQTATNDNSTVSDQTSTDNTNSNINTGSEDSQNSSKTTSSNTVTQTGASSSVNSTTTTKTALNQQEKEKIQAEITFYQTIVDTEADWLASMQLDNGVLPMTYAENGKLNANPYFSDFAALAILDGNKKYFSNVKKYMDWHFSHLNTSATDYNGVDGTIYDYTVSVSGGAVIGESITINDKNQKSYDSTDSYAATFLTVLSKYYEKSGDSAYIVQHYSEITRIIHAMYSTMDNNLTLAKPDYAVKYLMDNCEVYEGIVAAIHLYEKILTPKFNDASAMLSKLQADKNTVASAIENQMWNGSGRYYEPALFKNGDIAYSFDWNTFYPCATCQIFPITCGVISADSDRAKLVYANFNQHYSTGKTNYSWEQISIPDAFYWGSLAYCGAVMGDESRVKSYMTQYKKIMNRHAYPLYNADAGKVCMAAAIMVEKLNAKL